MPVAEMFGATAGQLEDPFGHRWSVATHTRDLTPAEIAEGMAKMGSARPELNDAAPRPTFCRSRTATSQ